MARKVTHEYSCWAMMKQRCLNPNRSNYWRYGGAGIRVCERWLSFDKFLADMGPAPTLKHSLDRWPNGGGDYEPGNVRWATQSQQMQHASPACRDNLKVQQVKGKPKSAQHRAAMQGCQTGKPKAKWTQARRDAFSKTLQTKAAKNG